MAKTKALISFAVTAKLICVFVFAYAKIRFSHDAAHNVLTLYTEAASEVRTLLVVIRPVIGWMVNVSSALMLNAESWILYMTRFSGLVMSASTALTSTTLLPMGS